MQFSIPKSVLVNLVENYVSSLITLKDGATLDLSFEGDSVEVYIGSTGPISVPATTQTNTVTTAPVEATETEEKPKRKYTRRNVEVAEKPSPEREPEPETPVEEPEQEELPFEPNGEAVQVEDEQPVGEELDPVYQEDKAPAVVEEAPPSAPKRGLFSGLKKPVNN